ncbi:hypothetical protein MRX96_024338 [Rhipicephalus microplus]
MEALLYDAHQCARYESVVRSQREQAAGLRNIDQGQRERSAQVQVGDAKLEHTQRSEQHSRSFLGREQDGGLELQRLGHQMRVAGQQNAVDNRYVEDNLKQRQRCTSKIDTKELRVAHVPESCASTVPLID